ncbi:hypothetical protein [Polaribacter butkevichii]|uniref:Uncharacterized protein n=1 Tax=Polaribacter butkevichii TaxID=218490 RepID=A0A2P6CC21_9FLAO|nr:hypothetical protein [Polaribacter butkevichii]PQJ72455.1 hypothetical protein BTO14_03960 [Polaribacter butkevichii]
MRTILKTSVFVAGLILLSSPFICCDSNEIKKETIAIVDNNTIKNEIAVNVAARKPIVFITGFDKGNETFYSNARAYFQEKDIKIIDGQYSLEEIILWLNKNANKHPYGDIHIVNKSNPYKGMNLETIVRGDKITTETLKRSLKEGTLPSLKDVVNNNTKIVFHASGLVENATLLNTLKSALSAKSLPKVIASPYYTVFGGKFSNYYLAQPYYVFYPTANSPGKIDLSKEIARKYPEEKDINWYDALNNEEERYVGEPYTKQFSIPIKWEFGYHNTDDEMPIFTSQEEVMDWIEQNEELMVEMNAHNIPLEKYRWNWSTKNSTLIIRGRTSGLVVLKPLIKPYGDLEHIEPDTNNKRLYAMK